MFCFQCQETARGTGCTIKGICGKQETTSNLQDLPIYNFKGIAVLGQGLNGQRGDTLKDVGRFVSKVLFTTMAVLDEANTTAYGNPEISQVNIGALYSFMACGACRIFGMSTGWTGHMPPII